MPSEQFYFPFLTLRLAQDPETGIPALISNVKIAVHPGEFVSLTNFVPPIPGNTNYLLEYTVSGKIKSDWAYDWMDEFVFEKKPDQDALYLVSIRVYLAGNVVASMSGNIKGDGTIPV